MKGPLQSTTWCGKERFHFEIIDSTNKKAKELSKEGCKHGTLITADSQQAGIGRRGRSWSSEKGAGIYMTMLLRPQIKTEHVSSLTLVAAISVAKAIDEIINDEANEIEIKIKWPNDIVINRKKICGILTELSLEGCNIESLVIGIGINVLNQTFPDEIKETASSIFLETQKEIEKEELIEQVWKNFEYYYDLFLQTQDLQGLKNDYESMLANQNQIVKVLDPNGEYEGIARGITNTGELLVETEQGICQVSSGEVSVRGICGYV